MALQLPGASVALLPGISSLQHPQARHRSKSCGLLFDNEVYGSSQLPSAKMQNVSLPPRRVSRLKVTMRIGGSGGRTRLVDSLRSLPLKLKQYFKSPLQRAVYGGISLLGGFYIAQTISLSFGALGVNDVIAAAASVLFTEYVSRYYHTRKRPTFAVALLNVFKMGFTYGLFIDAFKLSS